MKDHAKDHAQLIEALGGGSKVAAWLSTHVGKEIDRERVYKWQENGVAWRFRHLVAAMADEKNVNLPPNFLLTVDAA